MWFFFLSQQRDTGDFGPELESLADEGGCSFECWAQGKNLPESPINVEQNKGKAELSVRTEKPYGKERQQAKPSPKAVNMNMMM